MNTYTVTLELPEAIYRQLSDRSRQLQRSLEHELLAILATKIHTADSPESMPLAYKEVVEFLGRGATAKEITEFRLSSEAQARAQSLLQKNREGTLSPSEEVELDLYIELEDFIGLIKIQALQQLQNNQS
jgi:hypothetical protein